MREWNQKLSRISLDLQAGVKEDAIPKSHRRPPVRPVKRTEPTMTRRAPADTLTAATACPLPGTWKLARGQAITLRPPTDGVLRVAHGRLWATRDGPHGGTPTDAGDHILQAGRSMLVRAGDRVVIEGWTAGGASYFAWDPVCVTQPEASPRVRVQLAAVRQSLAQLQLASRLFVRALFALGRGLVQLAWQGVRGGPPRRGAQGAAG
jgi:hypothetical protein